MIWGYSMKNDLHTRREYERQKYLHVSPGYGSTNHGQKAYDIVMAYAPKVVVDFGCGGNQFCTELRKRGPQTIGVDFANKGADVMAPMHDTRLNGDLADVVTSFDALEHLLPDDVHPTLLEMQRVTRVGGAFVFSISHEPSRITVKGENLHPTVRPRDWWLDQLGWYGVVDPDSGRYIQGIWT